MIQPTIRCANPECACEVSMTEAMRVGTRLYCSFRCANGERQATPSKSPSRAFDAVRAANIALQRKAG